MKNNTKTKEQLLVELSKLNNKITELQKSETEKKHAEEELRKSREYIQSILENSLDLIFTVKPDGSFNYFNKNLEPITGYSAKDISGKPFIEFVVEDERPGVMESWVGEAIKGIPGTYETKITKADGEIADVFYSFSLLKEYKEVLVVMKDITERKQTEEELRKSREYIQSILDNSLDLIFTVKPDGSFNYFNKSLEPITGYSAEDISGKPFIEFVVEDERPGVMESWIGEAIKGIPGTYETKIIKADGAIADVFYSFSLLKEYKEVLVVMKDITERKQAEEELKRHREHLEELVGDRTKELEEKNAELDRAMKMFVGRELTIKNLQERIRSLEKEDK